MKNTQIKKMETITIDKVEEARTKKFSSLLWKIQDDSEHINWCRGILQDIKHIKENGDNSPQLSERFLEEICMYDESPKNLDEKKKDIVYDKVDTSNVLFDNVNKLESELKEHRNELKPDEISNIEKHIEIGWNTLSQ